MVVLAHIGHWTTSLAFFGPVLVLPLALYLVMRFGKPGERD
jgi:hypothetical protein